MHQYYVSRQKLTIVGEKKALDDDATLSAAGIADGGAVAAKDLGPQISWRTVFIIEYVRQDLASLNLSGTTSNVSWIWGTLSSGVTLDILTKEADLLIVAFKI